MRHSDHSPNVKVEQVENGYIVQYSEMSYDKTKIYKTLSEVVIFLSNYYKEEI